MKKRWLVIAVVVFAGSGGLACLFWPEADAGVAGRSDLAPAEVDPPTAFVRSVDERGEVDAGVGRVTGVVFADEGAAAAGALVRLLDHAPELEALECGECHAHVLDCGAPATAKQLLAGLRAGAHPPPRVLAEVRADAEGRFSFEAAPLNGLLVASLGAQQGEVALDGEGETVIALDDAQHAAVTVVDQAGEPLRGATVTVYSPRDGTLQALTSDAQGLVEVSYFDPRTWVAGEASGRLPAGARPSEELQLMLSEPRALVVRTRVGGQPVEAEVTIAGHGDPRTYRARGGVLALEGFPVGMLTVRAQDGEFASAEQGVELFDERTEVDFELRRGAKLFLTVVTELGEPLEHVYAGLNGVEGVVSAEADQGAVLVLGPMPEGEYSLNVVSEGRVTVERQLDLKPGETSLEVTMRSAPRLSGVVVDAEGKPVERARVTALEDGQETAVTLTDEAGAFDLELRFAGPVTLAAQQPRFGEASVTVTAPAAGVKLQLSERAVLEVELTDFDGAVVPGDFSVRQPESGLMRWVEPPEGAVSRIAGLPSGKYLLEKFHPERVPVSKEVELVEGRVTRLSLRLDRGLSLSGTVVDHEGRPVAQAIVTLSGRRETILSTEDGRFSWTGLVAGPAELHVSRQNGQNTSLSLTLPSKDVVVRLDAVARARGRVVDERGAVIPEFDVNGLTIKAADGRFDVEIPNGMIDVYVSGHTPAFLDGVKGDVGDVVLERPVEVEGLVIDPEGRPVGGASVTAERDSVPVVSDAAGRFKLPSSAEEPVGIVATRGAFSGRATAAPGARDVRIVLQRGTKVVGRVLGPADRAGSTRVRASLVGDGSRAVELETDEAGRFEAELAQGLWLFAARGVAAERVIELRGDRQEVTLGDDGTRCGLVVTAPGLITQLLVLPGPVPADVGPYEYFGATSGSVSVPVRQPSQQLSVSGLPCGRYELVAMVDGSFLREPLDLRAAAQAVTLTAPPPEPVTGDPGLGVPAFPGLILHR